MGKNENKEQPDPIVEALGKIAEIRAVSLQRDPDFMKDIEREIAEREATKLASKPTSEAKKPVRKIPPGAYANEIYHRARLGKDF